MVGGGKPDTPVRKKGVLLISYKRGENILRGECQKGKISSGDLRKGSWRGRVPGVRSETAERLVKELGTPLMGGGPVIGCLQIGHF